MDCESFREDMLSVLYGEADAASCARFEAHRSSCGRCREELRALNGLRRTLAAWKAPERAVPVAAPTLASLRGLAAAAGLLLAVGGALGLSGAQFQYSRGGFSARIGRNGSQDVQPLLAALERRHRQEIAGLEARLRVSAVAPSSAPPPARDDTALLARVEALIRESEGRQAALRDASLRKLGEQADTQRRYDLARISAGFSYLEGKTGQQVARTTELMGYVLQASQKR
jgi:hypothetical protein